MEDEKARSNRRVEQFAAAHARKRGRGLIVAAVTGNTAQLLFVTVEAWLANPLPVLAGNQQIEAWLREYDADREFILIEAINEGSDMIVYPLRLPYEQLLPLPTLPTLSA